MAESKPSSIPPSVVKVTRAVLLSSIKGEPLSKFSKDYKRLQGKEFPWRELGFKTFVDMLRAMPEAVRFEYSDKDGDYRLYGIADGRSYMPSWLVKAQGNRSQKPTGVLPPPVVIGDQSGLIYNARGLVCVYVRWKSEKPLDVVVMKDTLRRMMGRAGNPQDVYVHSSGYGFIRFKSMAEAQRAIDLYHNSKSNGLTFTVQPATESTEGGKHKIHRQRKKKHSSGKARKASRQNTGVRKPPSTVQLDQKHASHSQGLRSHDQGLRSHDQGLRSHDQVSRSHDQGLRSHDTGLKSHDQCPRSHDQGLKSHDQGLKSHDQASLRTDTQTTNLSMESWSTDSGSSLEWDEALFSSPIPFQEPTVPIPFQEPTVPIPGQYTAIDDSVPLSRFPGIADRAWNVILKTCSGVSYSWYERFGSVCSGTQMVVTEMCSACHFWARIDDKSGNQATIETCLKFLSPSEGQLEPGCVCAAFSTREHVWKRCWYEELMGAVGLLFYIDEGRWDHVPLENLTSLPPFVASLPSLAAPCCLSGLQLCSWSHESLLQGTSCLRQLVGGVHLNSKLMLNRKSSVLEPIPVILDRLESDTNINAAMLETGLVTLSSSSPSETASLLSIEDAGRRGHSVTPQQPTINHNTSNGRPVDEALSPWQLSHLNAPNENGLTPVIVSEVVSPAMIWLQMSLDPEGDVEKMSKMMADHSPSRVGLVHQGDVCCARVVDHVQFKRVQVQEIRQQVTQAQVNVVWIDTGSTHLLPLDQLRILPPDLAIAVLPPLAIPCQLSRVVSTFGSGQEWFPLDVQLLWKHLFHEKVYAKFVKQPSSVLNSGRGSRPGTVELYFDPEGIERVTELLVREGHHVDFDATDETYARVDGLPAKRQKPKINSPWKRLQETCRLLSDTNNYSSL